MPAAAAPSLKAVADVSAASRAFYVPQYEIRIEEAALPNDVLRDVVQVTYTDDVDQLDTFTIVVGNANDEHHAAAAGQGTNHEVRRFKYLGSETAADLADRSGTNRYTLFEPCSKEVQLHMGYLGNMELMMTGSFTTMAPRFPASGASTLEVRGINLLHQLRRKKYSDHWQKKKRSEIADLVATRRRRGNDDTRFTMQLCTNDNAKSSEPKIDFVAQKSEYDIDFLWKLARQEGYVLTVREKTDFQPRHVYFGPSGGVSSCNTDPEAGDAELQEPVTYVLEWGRSLIDFTPRITTANQFRSVTVNGWDREGQRAISATVDFTDRKLRDLNSDLHSLLINCDPREELVVDEPVFTEREAKQRARALLLDQHKQMVKASGSTVGLPRLRAGSMVEIAGLGSRLNGQYYVTKTTHTINESGYITKFEARREHIPEKT